MRFQPKPIKQVLAAEGNSSINSGTESFSRASNATVKDSEGLFKTSVFNETRREGYRRVENLLAFSEDLTQGQWAEIGGAVISNANTVNFPLTNNSRIVTSYTLAQLPVGSVVRHDVTLSGSGGIRIYPEDDTTWNANGSLAVTLTATPTRYSIIHTIQAGALKSSFGIRNFSGAVATATIEKQMIYNVTGQTNQEPSGYISTGVGAGQEIIVNGDYSQAGIGNIVQINPNTNVVNVANQLVISYGDNLYGIVGWDNLGVEGDTLVISADVIAITDSVRFLDISNNYQSSLVVGTRFSRVFRLGQSSKKCGFGGDNSGTFSLTLDNITLKKINNNSKVDGVKYFDYDTANTTDINGVILKSQGQKFLPNKLKGVVSEKASTNLLLHSQDHTNIVWNKYNGGTGLAPVITKDFALAPDGTQTASRIQLDIAGGVTQSDYSLVRQNATIDPLKNHVYSHWMRSNNGNTYTVNLSFVVGSPANVTVTPTWQRVEVARTTPANSQQEVDIILSGGIGVSANADILVWNSQIEEGAFATSEIETTTASVTRVREVISNTVASIPNSFSVMVDFELLANGSDFADTDFRIFSTDDSRGIGAQMRTLGSTTANSSSNNSGSISFNLLKTDFVIGTRYKACFTVSQEGANARAIYTLNGVEKVNTISVSTLDHSDLNTLNLLNWSTYTLNSVLRDYKLFTRPLTSAEMKAITI